MFRACILEFIAYIFPFLIFIVLHNMLFKVFYIIFRYFLKQIIFFLSLLLTENFLSLEIFNTFIVMKIFCSD